MAKRPFCALERDTRRKDRVKLGMKMRLVD
jgi:hypothetical protein